ncbi:hypothetical protein ACKLTP_17630 [Paenarthrobacter ureafaciens]|uniref:COG1470 family protein n=1 Tax=Paenarthrobacter TaxID=1742992 RepID=UPI0022320D84|nr:hypothetical protein [Paenarthrobacter sp. PAE-2]MCW3767501.1 hypothetical protein [Paenarthrobacter sp. PAE-2]
MDPTQERRRPFLRGGMPLRAVILAVLVALVPVTALAASNGQSNGQGTPGKEAKGIAVTLSPSSRSTDQGLAVTYTAAAASKGGFAGPVTFGVVGLPAGATAAWSPSSVNLTSGSTAQATLTVTTAPSTPAGKTDFTITGTGGGMQSTASAQLNVQEVKRNFGVTGTVNGPLAPGTSRPIELQIANPIGKSIAVTNVSVAISQVVRTPQAVAANLPCTTADYALTQFSGTYPFTVPAGSSSLSGLGIPQSKWPQTRMLDTQLLQDGCKGATLHFTYSGMGQGN